MTRLEKLKAAEADAWAAYDAVAYDAVDYDAYADAWDAFQAAHGGALWAARNAAWAAYRAELKKTQEENSND